MLADYLSIQIKESQIPKINSGFLIFVSKFVNTFIIGPNLDEWITRLGDDRINDDLEIMIKTQ